MLSRLPLAQDRASFAQGKFLPASFEQPRNPGIAEMPEIPSPAKQPDMKSAIEELKAEINNFFEFFEKHKDRTIINVFFGELNFDVAKFMCVAITDKRFG